jgi:hypothetical protein
MTMVVLIVASALLSRLNAGAVRREFDDQTTRVLAQAKEALIAFAATYPDYYPAGTPNTTEGPGQLPCPDTDDNGVADPPCGAVGLVPDTRRLPWRQLGLFDLRDGSGERLWYAVSGNHKNNAKTSPLNSETPGTLTIDGVGDFVAVVLAPGPALDGQSRGAVLVNSDYLEGGNEDGDEHFFSGPIGASFNDRLIGVTRDDLMRAAERRVMGEVRLLLNRYRVDHSNAYYPALRPLALVGGTATGGGVGMLSDTAASFSSPAVEVGDIVYRTSAPQGHAPIMQVNPNDLLFSGPESFAVGDTYEIRKRKGRVPSVLDIDASRHAPAWFFSEGWDVLTYVAVSSAEVEGGAAPCVAGSTCLTLLNSVGPIDDKKAIVLVVGRPLTGQSRAPGNPAETIADYFEGANADGDDVYTRAAPGAAFNDQAAAVSP